MSKTNFYLALLLTAYGLAVAPQVRAESETELIRKLDASIARAIEFLAERQSPDGGWRSDVYAPFKQGDSLTPLVLTAILPLPMDDVTQPMADRGLDWLSKLTSRTFADAGATESLNYPVYTAANATIALHQFRRAQDDAARGMWLSFLRRLQLTEATGWSRDDLDHFEYYGGWGYGHSAPQKPAADQKLGMLDEPNLSATAHALVALHCAGVGKEDALASALRFVQNCQNICEFEGSRDFGGFIFVHGDPVRNKAGKSAVLGVRHFAAYGSATADGLLALLACGAKSSAFQVVSVRNWLETNFSADHHPGHYSADREEVRDALYFYYASAFARAYRQLQVAEWSIDGRTIYWPAELTAALLQRQRMDGSWKNDVVDQREDDPIVATVFAIQALTACRAMKAHSAGIVSKQVENDSIVCHARDATCHGEKLQFEPQPQKNTLGYWVNERDWASWKLQVDKPGEFEVIVLQGCGAGQGGSEVEVSIGEAKLTFTVEDTGHFQNFKSRSLGKLKIDKSGMHEIIVKPLCKVKAAVMDVRQIQLKPL